MGIVKGYLVNQENVMNFVIWFGVGVVVLYMIVIEIINELNKVFIGGMCLVEGFVQVVVLIVLMEGYEVDLQIVFQVLFGVSYGF